MTSAESPKPMQSGPFNDALSEAGLDELAEIARAAAVKIGGFPRIPRRRDS